MNWAFMVILLPIAAAAQPAPQLHDVEPLDRAMTTRSYTIFRQHCPGLAAAAPYIASVRLDDMAVIMSDAAEQRGWSIAVTIGIKMRDSQASSTWQSQNGVLKSVLFSLGAGKDPGIIPSATGYRFCTGANGDFISAPDLKFLTRWPSDIADEKSHPHRQLDSTSYPLGEGPPIPAVK